MAKSPCIGCELEAADKNNPTCRECDRRVEYVALIAGGGSIMGATKETEVGDQISEVEGRRKVEKECIIEGCEKKAHARGLCHSDYKRWRDGDIEHPTIGKFFKIRGVKKTKKKETNAQHSTSNIERRIKKQTALPPLVAVQLSLYPVIQKVINDTAEKYFVTPEHVIIGLLGEALAARSGHE